MMHNDAFKHCLLHLDVPRARALWQHTHPHLPQPSDEEMLATLHNARTQANSIPLKLRAYSHAWLRERDLPSNLPDHLKVRAERMYPVIATSVGVIVGGRSAISPYVQSAMNHAVLETYADGHKDQPHIVKARMMEARAGVFKKLLGLLEPPTRGRKA